MARHASAAACARRATHALASTSAPGASFHTAAASAFAAARLGNVGQPTPETHPQLLRPGEVTPGVSGAEYAARRAALAARMPPDSLAVLAAAPVLRFHGTEIPVPSAYRQVTWRSA